MSIDIVYAAVAVPDLAATLAAIAGRGIEPGEVTSGVLSRLTAVRDPAGNTVTLAEVPTR